MAVRPLFFCIFFPFSENLLDEIGLLDEFGVLGDVLVYGVKLAYIDEIDVLGDILAYWIMDEIGVSGDISV